LGFGGFDPVNDLPFLETTNRNLIFLSLMPFIINGEFYEFQ